MRYFKIIKENNVIEVSTILIRIDRNHNIPFNSDINKAQFVQSRNGETLYHDNWLRSVQDVTYDYEPATIIEINQSEYEELEAMLEEYETLQVELKPDTETITQEICEEYENNKEEKPMSISEMRAKIEELTDLVSKLTSVISKLNVD